MDKLPSIDNIYFVPKARTPDGFVGFMSFVYNKDITIKSVAVYERLDKSGYRLSYPSDMRFNRSYVSPNNKRIQFYIEDKFNEFLKTNFDIVDGEFEFNMNRENIPLYLLQAKKEIEEAKRLRQLSNPLSQEGANGQSR